ncbi:MAG TPA: tetratricopeptide repeat protein, partial [Thermoanaerobaculia bacterium]|nr:tetratricopeptide repeat protein [Thermoanaerobaculia bacterium]
RLSRPEEALRLASESLELDSSSVEALVIRAQALQALGRSADARRAFEAVRDADPGNVAAARALQAPTKEADRGDLRVRLEIDGKKAQR